MTKYYSLSKSRHILHSAYRLLRKTNMLAQDKQKLRHILESLEEALFQKDRKQASEYACQAQEFQKQFPPSMSNKIWEITKAILFAGILAFLIRQFWFELYEVPTGSMRPTILEQDRLLVSKTTFGLHLPFIKKPWGFQPRSITRGGLVVFSVDNLPISNPETKYFGIFPGKKRYIKRCIGKPGDIVYFYGGKLYGIDEQEQPILFPKEAFDHLHHVPFISFDGVVESSSRTTYFKQMNQACGKIALPQESTYGQFYHQDTWQDDLPNLLKHPHTHPVSYADLFGMNHYGMARILTHAQASLIHQIPQELTSSTYLEISHTPNTSYPQPHFQHYKNQLIATICPMTALLPIGEEQLQNIKHHLNTSRFVVASGYAYKYQAEAQSPSQPFRLSLPGVDDGCYEYIQGQAYKIGFGGIRHQLPLSHPLMKLNTHQIIDLFNCGIHFSSVFIPNHPQYAPLPNRYVFYRNGGLYVMNTPLFERNTPTLQKFIEQEKNKQALSSSNRPYIAFTDHGCPPEDPEQFVTFIRNFGLRVPQGHIFVLGDNYPMSADSREFGFVPVENLLGSPLCILWPLGHHHHLTNITAPTTLPGYLVNGMAVIILITAYGYVYSKKHRRLFPKNKEE